MSEPAGDGAAPTIDAARYRQVLGHFATGVTIVTGMDGPRPVGLSANAFTSVSLDPPLVSVCLAETSTTWPRIRASGSFCVNILADDQEDLSRLFSTRGADRFAAVGWHGAGSGSPVLAGVLAWIDCALDAEHRAGDHVIAVGRVLDLDVTGPGQPLVFYRGGYGRFEP